MEKIMDILLSRLAEKGVAPLHVPYLVRDIIHSVGEESRISLESINARLESLGWGKDILDDFILELILSVVDSGYTDIGIYFERNGQWT